MQPEQNIKILTPEEADPTGPDPFEVSQANRDMETMHPYQQLFTADSGLAYPEAAPDDPPGQVVLNTASMNVEVSVPMASELAPEEFAMIRRDGFGGSDSSVLLGVNPYTNKNELLRQKVSLTLSEEEKEVGNQIAVIKGNDLEPLVIQKFERFFGLKTYKPTDMYKFRDWPFLNMNFDGITGDANQYYPVEIKIITKKGEKHYNPMKAIFAEGLGHMPLPQNYAITNNSWDTKSAQYGIPPYYYTQLQQEMFACNAPFGFLCTLNESNWKVYCYFVHKDQTCWNMLTIEGFKAWEQVKRMKAAQITPTLPPM